MIRRGVSLVVLAMICAAPRPAAAQTETRAAVAEALYGQARDLMAAGKYEQACPKFAESQRLDPATGTLLNLAACHEKQGKLATAWLEYSDAQVAARRDARQDRVEYAHDRAQALEPKLSRLTLLFATDADDPTLSIELDGSSVGRAVIGAPTPVDPGTHTVRVTATGKKPWTANIEIGAAADQQSLTIPQLENAPPGAEPLGAAASTASASGGSATPAPRDELAARPIPTSVYLAGGVTLALTAGAGATGLAYLKKRDDYRQRMNASDAEARRNSALEYGYLNVGMWTAAAVGAGVTTYLYVTRPSQPASARVVPWAGPECAGVSVTGGF